MNFGIRELIIICIILPFLFSAVDGKVFEVEGYPKFKICNGEMRGTDLHYENAYVSYRRIKEQYENCTHVMGNLVLVDLGEYYTNRMGETIYANYSFLESIQEVNGVVQIRGVWAKTLPLINLRVIRGMKTYVPDKNRNISLYIGINNHNTDAFFKYLHSIDLRNLVSVSGGNIVIESNPGLCYIPNTIDWSYIIENPKLQSFKSQFPEYNVRFCEEFVRRMNISGVEYVGRNGSSCHNSCPLVEGRRLCWGPGKDQCQKVDLCDRSKCPETGRCFNSKELKMQRCCHSECRGGCNGESESDCFACSNFLNGDRCVNQCPPLKIYNRYTRLKEKNPNFRYSFGTFCVKNCPSYSLIKEDACEAYCNLRHNYVEGKKCLPCKDDKCEKNCFMEDITKGIKDKDLADLSSLTATKYVLEQLKGCEQVQGRFKVTDSIRTAKKKNLLREIPDYKSFMNLKDVKVWIGSVHLDLHQAYPTVKNLSFLSNLETLRSVHDGFQLSRSDVEFLGLKSLKYVSVEKMYFMFNKRLCYDSSISKDSFVDSYMKFGLYLNKKKEDCEKEGKVCDVNCVKELGCWGPGPSMCVKCRNRSAAGVCTDKCEAVAGFYSDTKSDECRRCHKECAGTCSGPGADQCVDGCLNAKLNQTCVRRCPRNMFLNEKTHQCSPCSSMCKSVPGFRQCSGPLPMVGVGGCTSCMKMEVYESPSKRLIQCVSSCKTDFFEGVFDDSYLPGSNLTRSDLGPHLPSLCIPCHPMCEACTASGVTNCVRCRHFFYRGVCSKFCPPEDTYAAEYSNATGARKCKVCHESCRNGCSGPGPLNCNACKVRKIYLNEAKTKFRCNSSCPSDRSFPHFEESTEDSVCKQYPVTVNRQTKMVIIYSSVGVVSVLIVIVIIIAIVCCQRRRSLVKERKLLEMIYLRPVKVEEVPLKETNLQPNSSQLRIIGANQVTKGKEIGSGAFGTVYLGTWRPTKEKSAETQLEIRVAVKTLKDSGGEGFGSSATNDFLAEAHVMASVDHPFCMSLVGVCLTSQVQLISEFMPLGSLADYLPKNKHELGSHQLLKWAVQIAKGMVYLESRGIIHRDLAARNVLLQSVQQVRITDFGLAKLMDDDQNGEFFADGGRFPVKWLAIECLRRRVFSHKSDVWAFGVTLWEICSLGERPYQDVRATELVDFLERGERLQQPDICTLDMYMLMIKCWLLEADSRPTFEELEADLKKKAADPARYLVIPNDQGRSVPLRSISATSNGSLPPRPSPNPVRSRSETPDVTRLDERKTLGVRGASASPGFTHLTDEVNRRKASSPQRTHGSDDSRYVADPMLSENSEEVFPDYLTPTDVPRRPFPNEDDAYLEADRHPSHEYYNETASRSPPAYVNTEPATVDDYLNPKGIRPAVHNPEYLNDKSITPQTALLKSEEEDEDEEVEENGYLLPSDLKAVHNPQYLRADNAYLQVLPRSNRSTPNKDLV